MPNHEVTNRLSIGAYMHCAKCLDERRANRTACSPADYARLSIGWTEVGIQIWCNRHNCNVMHVDFQGQKHPANTSARIDPRDPDPTREGVFRDHNCYRCDSGAKPCATGNAGTCDYKRARND